MAQIASGKVVAGDYKGKLIVAKGFTDLKPVIKLRALSLKKENEIEINGDTVDKYEIKNTGVTKNKVGVGLAIVGAGKMGAEKDGVQIAIYWKDGKKSLIQCNGEMEDIIHKNCF